MARPVKFLDHVVIKRPAKGRGKEYLYFNTGMKKPNGRPELVRLPGRSDPDFGKVYAACKAARTRRERVTVRTTLADLIAAYYRSRGFARQSDGTQRTYLTYLRKLEHLMGVAPADEFTRKDVVNLVESMGPGAGNMMLTVISNVYAFGRKMELTDKDPAKDVEKEPKGEHQPWDEKLLAEALASPDLAVREPVALLYYTAQRIGDVLAMRWTDIDPDGVLVITQQKTGKELDIPIHAELRKVLAAIRGRMKVIDISRTILADEDGNPLKVDTVRHRLQRWAAERGHRVVPHGLRKNAVCALIEAGCDTGETASISGQTLQIVEHYAKKMNRKKMARGAILKWERTK